MFANFITGSHGCQIWTELVSTEITSREVPVQILDGDVLSYLRFIVGACLKIGHDRFLLHFNTRPPTQQRHKVAQYSATHMWVLQ